MLKKIEIGNFLTIEHISLEIDSKITAIVGESGAGKSLLLKAIDGVFSQKTSTDIIGKFGEESFIKLSFKLNQKQREYLSEFGIKEDEIVIEKIIKPKKTKSYINHEPINARVLFEIKDNLLNIVSQNYRFKAFSFENLLNVIDKLINKKIKEGFNVAYKSFSEIEKKKQEIETQISAINDKHPEILVESIEKTNPKDGEYEKLLNTLKKVKSISEVKERVRQMIDELYENDNSVESVVKRLEQSAEKIGFLGFETAHIKETFSNILDNVLNIKSDLHDMLDGTYEDVDIDSIESRLFELEQLQRKFNKTLDEIIEEKKELSMLLQKKDELLFEFENIEKDLIQKKFKLEEKADNLSNERKKAAKKIEKQIQDFLSEMLLGNSVVQFEFSKKKTDKNGYDNIVILFSANPDISTDKIEKIVSGGERSRFILAMESTHSLADDCGETIILDEIESGISDKTLQKVANIIKKLSQKNEIILITHNSYLASIAKKVFKIRKEFVRNVTKSFVE